MLKEFFRILRKLNFRRFFNLLWNQTGYLLSRCFGKPFVLGSPWAVTIEPTNHCNLACPECPSGTGDMKRPRGHIDPTLFKKAITELKGTAFYLNLYFQGEPFLHPQLIELIDEAVRQKYFVTISTNGHFLDKDTCVKLIEAGTGKIIISMDGSDEESYSLYRKGGNFSQVLSGIRTLAETRRESKRKNPIIEIQSLLTSATEKQTASIYTIGKESGADRVVFKTLQVYHNHDLLPKNPNYSRYKTNSDGSVIARRKAPRHCRRLWSTFVLTWDGKVVPCCQDKNADHAIVNTSENHLLDLWKSKEMNAFRQKVQSGSQHVEICRNCDL
jgi:radical SAM protein with 4Fe4S-binding SPASM domain